MNYLAHALPFLDDPYFVAGTGVPDWLSVVDRRVRVRSKQVRPFLSDADPETAAVAGGILQHLRDDVRFHESRPFAELTLALSAKVRDVLNVESGFQSSFLGHLLVEVLLDGALVAEDPEQMEAYYQTLQAVDARQVQQAVNRMATKQTDRLAAMISEFCRLRILSDYAEDAKLMGRLGQVMRRVGFDPPPEHFVELLPEARRMVAGRKEALLEGIPTSS
ncbi:MAG: hypothetical protein JXB62_23110 [Pirellulales bacterium]|nr:hypothetical protein [Pirellulales bacterium]